MDENLTKNVILQLGMQITQLCQENKWQYLLWSFRLNQEVDTVEFVIAQRGHHAYVRITGLLQSISGSGWFWLTPLTNRHVTKLIGDALTNDTALTEPLVITGQQLRDFAIAW